MMAGVAVIDFPFFPLPVSGPVPALPIFPAASTSVNAPFLPPRLECFTPRGLARLFGTCFMSSQSGAERAAQAPTVSRSAGSAHPLPLPPSAPIVGRAEAERDSVVDLWVAPEWRLPFPLQKDLPPAPKSRLETLLTEHATDESFVLPDGEYEYGPLRVFMSENGYRLVVFGAPGPEGEWASKRWYSRVYTMVRDFETYGLRASTTLLSPTVHLGRTTATLAIGRRPDQQTYATRVLRLAHVGNVRLGVRPLFDDEHLIVPYDGEWGTPLLPWERFIRRAMYSSGRCHTSLAYLLADPVEFLHAIRLTPWVSMGVVRLMSPSEGRGYGVDVTVRNEIADVFEQSAVRLRPLRATSSTEDTRSYCVPIAPEGAMPADIGRRLDPWVELLQDLRPARGGERALTRYGVFLPFAITVGRDADTTIQRQLAERVVESWARSAYTRHDIRPGDWARVQVGNVERFYTFDVLIGYDGFETSWLIDDRGTRDFLFGMADSQASRLDFNIAEVFPGFLDGELNTNAPTHEYLFLHGLRRQ